MDAAVVDNRAFLSDYALNFFGTTEEGKGPLEVLTEAHARGDLDVAFFERMKGLNKPLVRRGTVHISEIFKVLRGN